MKKVILKPFREKSVLKKHPWIFSGAVEKIQGSPEPGETVLVLTYKKEPLGIGSYSPDSQICVRMWSFDLEEKISEEFFFKKIRTAFSLREELGINKRTDAFRVINSESDGLPGVIVDCYGKFLVCQFLSAGAEFWREAIIASLKDIFSGFSIYERSDVMVRKKEGLELRKGVLFGEEPPDLLKIEENGFVFFVDIKGGHKTGFYLDQRDNRLEAGNYAEGKSVLNCFSYTGSFGVVALKCGAREVLNIDSSRRVLELAKKNFELNSLDSEGIEFLKGNAFKILRYLRDKARKFDLVILDPPKLIHSQKTFKRGLAGYKDINLLGIKLLKPGGILITFSCSGLLPAYMFQKAVADASVDAGREVKILKRLGMPCDHLTSVTFPEGAYLKGLVCRVN